MPRRRVYNSTAGQYTSYINLSATTNQLTVFYVPSLPEKYQLVATIVVVPVNNVATFYSEYETFILKIIQYIIDKVSLDTVIKEIQEIQTDIHDLRDAEKALQPSKPSC